MKITYRSFLLLILCFLLAFTSCACKAQKDDVPAQLAVTASAPAPDETGVTSTLGSVALTFNQALRAPADMSKITLKNTASEQTVSLSSAEVAGSGIFISLAERLSPSTAYELRLESGAVTSQTGLVMDEYKLNFTTGDEQNADTQPPVLLQTYPENNGQDFDPAGEILFLFDEPIMQGTNYEQIALVAADGTSLPITKNIVGSQLTIRAEMKPDSSYNLLVPNAALRDYAMNDFAEPVFLAFTTAGQPVQDDAAQAKPLTVSATVPKNGAADVSTSTMVSVVFSASVQKGSAFDSVSITPESGGNNCITGKSISGNTLKLNAALAPATTYKVTIPQNAVLSASGAGNAEKAFRFTTSRPQTPSVPEVNPPAKDTQPPKVVLSVPAANENNVPTDLTQITVRFQENIVQGEAFLDCSLTEASGAEVPVTLGVSGNTVTAALSNALKPGTAYKFTVPARAVADMSGNTLKDVLALTFTTAKKEVTTQPTTQAITTVENTTADSTSESTTAQQTTVPTTQPQPITFAGQSYPADTKAIAVKDVVLTDLSALSGFKNLEDLTLNNTDISDISALASLQNLKHLNLELNQISDISPLASLTGLQTLNLRFNSIKTVSALNGLVNLKELIISDNEITDISALRTLTGLQSLSITNNIITSVEPLSEMKQLTFLASEFNRISDVSPLAGLTRLQTLYLSKNNLSNVSALGSLQALNELLLSSNQLDNTVGLEKLKNLKSLYLSDNPLSQSQISNLKLALAGCDIVF